MPTAPTLSLDPIEQARADRHRVAMRDAAELIDDAERVLATLVPRDSALGASVGEALDSLTQAVRRLRDAVDAGIETRPSAEGRML